MKHLALLSVCCMLALAGVGLPGAAVGQTVSYAEADELMGQCGDYGPLKKYVCYGGCMGGGCGCAQIQEIISGDYKIADAVPCTTSYYCTAQKSVSDKLCGY